MNKNMANTKIGAQKTAAHKIGISVEDKSFQLVEIQVEPDLLIAGEFKDKPNYNSGVASEPRWPRW